MVLDDGAVIYVNGTEAGRANLPTGAIGFTTKAVTDVTGAAENTPIAVNLSTGAFKLGTNTIAIEVHNKANAPGDLGLDAELKLNAGGGGGGSSTLFDFGSVWKYLDPSVDQGTAWRASTFDDASWASGPGMFGFGNTGVVTTLTKAQQRTTYYFRRTFTVTGTPTPATLELLRDDGAVVYVNGQEVARSNMPTGAHHLRHQGLDRDHRSRRDHVGEAADPGQRVPDRHPTPSPSRSTRSATRPAT